MRREHSEEDFDTCYDPNIEGIYANQMLNQSSCGRSEDGKKIKSAFYLD